MLLTKKSVENTGDKIELLTEIWAFSRKFFTGLATA